MMALLFNKNIKIRKSYFDMAAHQVFFNNCQNGF